VNLIDDSTLEAFFAERLEDQQDGILRFSIKRECLFCARSIVGI